MRDHRHDSRVPRLEMKNSHSVVQSKVSFAPSGLSHFFWFTHGLRRGLHSLAATRLEGRDIAGLAYSGRERKIWKTLPSGSTASHASPAFCQGRRTVCAPRASSRARSDSTSFTSKMSFTGVCSRGMGGDSIETLLAISAEMACREKRAPTVSKFAQVSIQSRLTYVEHRATQLHIQR